MQVLASGLSIRCVAAAVLAAGAVAAWAEPSGDGLDKLLQDRGLMPAANATAPGNAAPGGAGVPQAKTPAAATQPPAVSTTAGTAPSSFVETVRDKASELVVTSMNFLGVPYRRGGQSADTGFDCSGLTRYVFENTIGLVLPRRSKDQAEHAGLMKVSREDLKPGDLVFFNTLRSAFSHVGIYIGDNKFIHAPRTGEEVRVEDMRTSYWTKRYNGARRVPASFTASTPAADATGAVAPAAASFGPVATPPALAADPQTPSLR